MSEQTARDLVTEWHAPKYVREHLIAKIATALAQARRGALEEACQEVAQYSGITAEQTVALVTLIRQREGA